MHVVFFGDQHLDSLGGAQVSMRLQRRFLERAGHTVTVVAPRMHGARAARVRGDRGLRRHSRRCRSRPTASTRSPGRAGAPTGSSTARWRGRPPVDLVHVQADFWGAFIGHRFAQRHGLPVVHTMHNRVDVGIAGDGAVPRAACLRVLNVWQRRIAARRPPSGQSAVHDGWAYLRGFAAGRTAVTAPSTHFARRLEEHGVVPGRGSARIRGRRGLERHRRRRARRGARGSHRAATPDRPRFVWLGRMSPEKRLLPFLEAFVDSGVDADVEIIGGGGQRRAAARLVGGAAPRHRRVRRAGARTPRRCAASRPPTRSCRPRSASRRRG